MKNFIINIFKTLFFFDLGVIVISLLPEIEKKNPSLTKLISESLVLAVILIFTLVFILVLEKRKLTVPVLKKKIKSFFTGLSAGAVIPVVFVAISAVLKNFSFIGFNKISQSYLWILALLCNAIATELMLRGYLFSLYKRFYGFTFATVVTTLLYISLNFEILSQSKIYIANIILFNILLCFLLEYSNSVVATITARFTYTLLSTFMLGSLPLTGGYPVLINHTFTQKKFFVGAEIPLEGSGLLLCITGLLTLIFIIMKYHPVKQTVAFFKSLPQRIKAYKFRKHMQPKRRKAKRVKAKN